MPTGFPPSSGLHHAWELCSNQTLALCIVEGETRVQGCHQQDGIQKHIPTVSRQTISPAERARRFFYAGFPLWTSLDAAAFLREGYLGGNPEVSRWKTGKRAPKSVPLEDGTFEAEATTMDCVSTGNSHLEPRCSHTWDCSVSNAADICAFSC